MATCTTDIALYQSEKGDLEVIPKFEQLMASTLAEGSIYDRTKDTMYYQFKDLQLTEPQKAAALTELMSGITSSLTSAAMQTALSWAKEERDGAYTLAKVKADTEVALAQFEKTKSEICLAEAQTSLQCANITATLSGSIRENGSVLTYDTDGCKPLTLANSGLKYQQTLQVQGATYQIFADAYRKSGVVQIGTDIGDGVYKGLSGPVDSITGGYTNQQSLNAERQRIAYEDSKRNHVVNSSAAMVGQLLSAGNPESATEPLSKWNTAATYLLLDYASTPTI